MYYMRAGYIKMEKKMWSWSACAAVTKGFALYGLYSRPYFSWIWELNVDCRWGRFQGGLFLQLFFCSWSLLAVSSHLG